MPTQQQIEDALRHALDTLLNRDAYLLAMDVNERTISHRLAMYLEDEVAQWREAWNVDCEYNRDVLSRNDRYTKRLNLQDFGRTQVPVDDEHATTVYPDIVVHKRGTTGNLLVIEMKKSPSNDDGTFDMERKLPAFVAQLEYKYAVFICVEVGVPFGYSYRWIHPEQRAAK